MDSLLAKLQPLLTRQRLRYPYWIGCALWIGWVISILLGRGNTDAAGHLIGTDFVAFYTAGEILRTGQNSELYNFELAHQIQQLLYGGTSDNFNPYLNPPFYAWLFVPFAFLSYPWSPILWMALNLGFLWFSLKLLSPQKLLPVFLLTLTWQPAFAAISFGQNAFLSLAILCIVYILMTRNNRLAAGLTSGLLLYKPQLLIGLGIYWILDLRSNWRILLGMAISGIFLAASSYLILPQATLDYLFYIQKIASNLMNVPGFPIWNAHSVQSFWLGIFPGAVTLSVVLHWICAAAGFRIFLKNWKVLRGNPALSFGAAIMLTVWITPYIMVYDWVLLFIPAVLFWKVLPGCHGQLRVLYALIWVSMFLSTPLTFVQYSTLGRAIQLSIPIFTLVSLAIIRLLRSEVPIETSPITDG